MELSKQVITLEQAKRLKELGVNGGSICLYMEQDGHVSRVLYHAQTNPFLPMDAYRYNAYTVAELGVMLPIGWSIIHIGYRRNFGEKSRIYDVYRDVYLKDKGSYDDAEVGRESVNVWHTFDDYQPKTEAEARGAMLIYLLENKYITPDQVNASLK